MKKLVIGIIISVIVLIGLFTGGVWYSVATSQVPPQVIIEPSKYEVGPPDPQEMLELVNIEREKVGVAPLTIDENVQKSAQLKADDMANRNYFSHTIKGYDKGNLTKEMTSLIDESCVGGGENIHAGSDDTSKRAIESWKASEPHYKAMIDPKFTKTGFGVAYDDVILQSEKDPTLKYNSSSDIENAYISVQHFCIAK